MACQESERFSSTASHLLICRVLPRAHLPRLCQAADSSQKAAFQRTLYPELPYSKYFSIRPPYIVLRRKCTCGRFASCPDNSANSLFPPVVFSLLVPVHIQHFVLGASFPSVNVSSDLCHLYHLGCFTGGIFFGYGNKRNQRIQTTTDQQTHSHKKRAERRTTSKSTN